MRLFPLSGNSCLNEGCPGECQVGVCTPQNVECPLSCATRETLSCGMILRNQHLPEGGNLEESWCSENRFPLGERIFELEIPEGVSPGIVFESETESAVLEWIHIEDDPCIGGDCGIGNGGVEMLPVTESGTWLVRIEALEIGATFHLGLQCGEVEQDSPEGCLSSSSPVSSAEPCPACVCAQDPFCCQIAWDGACVGLSAQTCSDSCECALPAGSCCFESDGPLCDEGTCGSACVHCIPNAASMNGVPCASRAARRSVRGIAVVRNRKKHAVRPMLQRRARTLAAPRVCAVNFLIVVKWRGTVPARPWRSAGCVPRSVLAKAPGSEPRRV